MSLLVLATFHSTEHLQLLNFYLIPLVTSIITRTYKYVSYLFTYTFGKLAQHLMTTLLIETK